MGLYIELNILYLSPPPLPAQNVYWAVKALNDDRSTTRTLSNSFGSVLDTHAKK